MLAVLAAAILSLGTSAVAQTDGSTAVERLAERLLGYWGDPAVSRAEIFPERLPANAPVDIVLPDGAVLVGSVAHFERNELATLQIVVDAAQPPDEAMDALLGAFAERGWVATTMPPAVGFLPVQTSASGQACDPETGIFAFVHATSRRDAPTDIRIDVNVAAARYNPPCNAASMVPNPYADQAPLPALPAPLGSELMTHGTIHMPDQASSTAVVSLAGGAADVAAHYAGRLASAGWDVHATEASATHVVTTSTHVDALGSSWRGVLTVVALSGETPTYGLSFFVTPVASGEAGAATPIARAGKRP